MTSETPRSTELGSNLDEALDKMRSEVEEAKRKKEAQIQEALDCLLRTQKAPEQQKDPEDKMEDIGSPEGKPALIYISAYGDPAWIPAFNEVLRDGCPGVLPFVASLPVPQQFTRPEIEAIEALPRALDATLTAILKLPEALKDPITTSGEVMGRMEAAEGEGDFSAIIFRNLWFLSRSTLLLADLGTPSLGTAQELLYARLLGIPTIGILPESGRTNAWINHCCTHFLTSPVMFKALLSLIRGYTL